MPHNKHTFFKVNIVAFAAGIICLLVFLRALSCDFVNFDDHLSVLENKSIQSMNWQMLTDVFKTSMYGFWMPLTWISYAVDYRLWGLDPFGFHLTNILLHAINTSLVVIVTDRVLHKRYGDGGQGQGCNGWIYTSALLVAGLLWGIHPLRVESVVWVTERKDVLNGLFALLSLLAYLHYAEKRASGAEAWRYYLGALILFVCSLMAKPVTVVLPVMLLVLDWYPLERMKKESIAPVLIEKLPFILFASVLSILTIQTAVQKDMLITVERLSIGERFLVAGNALFEYMRLFVLPTGILPLHPLPHPIPVSYAITSSVVLLAVCSAIYFRRRSVSIPAYFLLFLLPLLPVLGFLQNGQQAFAARYTYLPHLALCVFTSAMVLKIFRASADKKIRIIIGVCVLILFALVTVTQYQIGIWKDSETLWTRVIEKYPVSTAYKSRASYYLFNGRYIDAVADYTYAIETAVGQEKLEVYNLLAGRATALGSAGRLAEAVRDFSAAINLYPHPSYYYSRGITYEAMGRIAEAQADLRRAGPAPGLIKWFEYGKGLAQ